MEGAGRLVCRNKEYRLEPGTCFLFTPGTKVWATNDEGEGVGMANFSAHFLPTSNENISPRTVKPIFGRKVRRMNLFLELAVEIISAFKQRDTLGQHQADWGLLTMIYHLWRESFDSPQAQQDQKIIELLGLTARSEGHSASIPDVAHTNDVKPGKIMGAMIRQSNAGDRRELGEFPMMERLEERFETFKSPASTRPLPVLSPLK